MHELHLQQQFSTGPDQTFAAITDHVGMSRWLSADVRLERQGTPAPNGLGAVRSVRSKGLTVREEVVHWSAPNAMDYRVIGGAPLENHLGQIRISADGRGSRVDYTIRFGWPWYLGGSLVGGVIAAALRKEIGGGLSRLAASMGA